MKTLEQDVRDKLDELRIASNGRLQYKVHIMDAAEVVDGSDSGEETKEQQLAQKGIVPFQMESVQSDELGVKLIYSAISISYREKADEVLARIYPENLEELEYSLVSKIYRMTFFQIAPGGKETTQKRQSGSF